LLSGEAKKKKRRKLRKKAVHDSQKVWGNCKKGCMVKGAADGQFRRGLRRRMFAGLRSPAGG
jgi:hypothetical protein